MIYVLQFGSLLTETWSQSAVASNAISGFQATEIFPYSADTIPDHTVISAEDSAGSQEEDLVTQGDTNVTPAKMPKTNKLWTLSKNVVEHLLKFLRRPNI